VGHITLGIGDIELIETEEVELDERDFVVVEERPARRANTGPRQVVQMPQPRRAAARRTPSFDDMPTVVRAVGRVAHGRR
jgi:hypothetical protein